MDSEEIFEFANQIRSSFNNSSAFQPKFPMRHRHGFAISLIVSFIWGTLMKQLIYQHLMNSKLLRRPINSMILVDEIFHHITNGFLIIQVSIWLISGNTNTTFSKLLHLDWIVSPHSYCKIFTTVGIFTFQYATYGSVGVAVLRVLYFKENTWALKSRLYVSLVPPITVAWTVISSWMFISEPGTARIALNSCMGRTENFQVSISNFHSNIYANETIVNKAEVK